MLVLDCELVEPSAFVLELRWNNCYVSLFLPFIPEMQTHGLIPKLLLVSQSSDLE